MTERTHPVRDQGIILTCEGSARHQKTIYTPDSNRREAENLAATIDGTRPCFIVDPPRACSGTAKCGICGAWIRGEVFGYE